MRSLQMYGSDTSAEPRCAGCDGLQTAEEHLVRGVRLMVLLHDMLSAQLDSSRVRHLLTGSLLHI